MQTFTHFLIIRSSQIFVQTSSTNTSHAPCLPFPLRIWKSSLSSNCWCKNLVRVTTSIGWPFENRRVSRDQKWKNRDEWEKIRSPTSSPYPVSDKRIGISLTGRGKMPEPRVAVEGREIWKWPVKVRSRVQRTWLTGVEHADLERTSSSNLLSHSLSLPFPPSSQFFMDFLLSTAVSSLPSCLPLSPFPRLIAPPACDLWTFFRPLAGL